MFVFYSMIRYERFLSTASIGMLKIEMVSASASPKFTSDITEYRPNVRNALEY